MLTRKDDSMTALTHEQLQAKIANIPDNEMNALYDWSTVELKRIEKSHPDIQGALGGSAGSKERKAHFKEYNRRLDAIKAKYVSP